jgi:hypothetical protein
MRSLEDNVLAGMIREHKFDTRAGVPVLPPARDLLGRRLHSALVKSGRVNSALGSAAQSALQDKGFTLAESSDGRVGLDPETPRTGGKNQRQERARDAAPGSDPQDFRTALPVTAPAGAGHEPRNRYRAAGAGVPAGESAVTLAAAAGYTPGRGGSTAGYTGNPPRRTQALVDMPMAASSSTAHVRGPAAVPTTDAAARLPIQGTTSTSPPTLPSIRDAFPLFDSWATPAHPRSRSQSPAPGPSRTHR